MFKSRKNQCSYIIFLALFLFFNPILVLAQTGSVTLSMKNATLKQFFEAVEKQTTYIFSYRDAIVEGKKEVTLNVTNQPIQRLLDDVLHQRDLQYTMTGHSIVVTLKTAGKVKQVSGTVVDSNGEPIIGANVVEKGTTNGTVTDISGNFSLNIDDTGILQISYIGFNMKSSLMNRPKPPLPPPVFIWPAWASRLSETELVFFIAGFQEDRQRGAEDAGEKAGQQYGRSPRGRACRTFSAAGWRRR